MPFDLTHVFASYLSSDALINPFWVTILCIVIIFIVLLWIMSSKCKFLEILATTLVCGIALLPVFVLQSDAIIEYGKRANLQDTDNMVLSSLS